MAPTDRHGRMEQEKDRPTNQETSISGVSIQLEFCAFALSLDLGKLAFSSSLILERTN